MPGGRVWGQQIEVTKGNLLDRMTAPKDTQNRSRVDVYKRKFSPRLYMGSKVTTFGFASKPDELNGGRYYPNIASAIGVGIFYKTVGISAAYLLTNRKQSDQRKEALGNTRYFDLSVNSYQTRFGLSLYYQSYRGFFIAQQQGSMYPPLAVDERYPQRGDVVLRNAGVSFLGISNWRKFSMQAAFQHTKRQVRSAGSFLWMGSLQYITIRGDSLLQTPRATSIQEEHAEGREGFQKGRFLSVNPLVGYGHTFVLKRMYLTGVYLVGPGVQYQRLSKTSDLANEYVSPFIGSSFKAAVGYNGDRIFTSFQVLYDANRNYFRGVRLQAATNSYSLQLGCRF